MKNYNNEIDSIDNKISEQEEKLFSINSTKEFEALQKETGDLKRLKLEIEDSQIKKNEYLYRRYNRRNKMDFK